MEKIKVNYWTDVFLMIAFLAVVITGVMKFKLITTLLGIPINYQSGPLYIISRVHDYSGIAMGLLVLLHLILNWDWIMEETKGLFSK